MPPSVEVPTPQAQAAQLGSGLCVCCGVGIGLPQGGILALTEVQSAQFRLSGHCPKCWRERYLICPCGSVSPYIDMTPVRVGPDMVMTPVCLSCFNDTVSACHRCGRPFQRLPGDDIGITKCPRCRNVVVCELCSNDFTEADSATAGILAPTGMKVCRMCMDKGTKPAQRRVMNHDERVHFLPLGDGPDFTGVELEVEVDGISADYEAVFGMCHDLTKHFCIIKKDGTIHRGFEIVSGPMSFAHHKTIWDDFLEKRPACLRSYDTKTCGMHVHYNKKALTTLQIGKILVFVNDPSNRSFIVAMAGRDSGTYNKIQPKKLEDATAHPGERYQAVNLVPKNTVEFRLFKGTLNRRSFLRNIEFAYAIVRFFKPSGGVESQTVGGVNEFSQFVSDNSGEYPNLAEFIYKSLKRTKEKGAKINVPGNI